MTKPRPAATALPVDPERLRRQFPGLDDDDLEAYVTVTRRILGEGNAERRARLAREVLARGRTFLDRRPPGEPLTGEDGLAARYVLAVEKMQPPVGRPRG